MKLRNLSEFKSFDKERMMLDLSNRVAEKQNYNASEPSALETSIPVTGSSGVPAALKSWCKDRQGKPIEFGYPWIGDEEF